MADESMIDKARKNHSLDLKGTATQAELMDGCKRVGGELEKSINGLTCNTGSEKVSIGEDADGFGVATLRADTGDGDVVKSKVHASGGPEALLVSKGSSISGKDVMRVEGDFGSSITLQQEGEQ